MKKIIFFFSLSFIVAFASCNNEGDKKEEAPVDATKKAQADSLEDQVMEGHNIAMPKSMKIPNLKKEVKRLIDSIGRLPPKAREAAAPYKARLESIYKELGEAYDSMENWMEAFGERMQELNTDSLKNNFEEKIRYYSQEKIKIDKIKGAVLGSVQKADSLIKSKI